MKINPISLWDKTRGQSLRDRPPSILCKVSHIPGINTVLLPFVCELNLQILCMKSAVQKRDIVLFNRSKRPGFENIYKENWAPLFGQLQKWLGNRDLASQICEDTFVKLWQERGGFASLEKVRAFLYKVARNAAIDQLRKRKTTVLWDFRILESINSSETIDIETPNLQTIIAQRLDRLVSELSPRAKEIIKLSYFEDLHNSEIAKLLGIKEKTVTNIKERAVKKLRLQLSSCPSVARLLRIWFLDLATRI